MIEWALKSSKAVRTKNEERDSKYPEFRRNDTHLWYRPLLYIGNLTKLV